jgi:hypothetical protein
MAKRKPARGAKKTKPRRKSASARPASKRAKPKAAPRRKRAAKMSVKRRPARKAREAPVPSGKQPQLDRVRRTLVDVVPTPPSSLDMDRRGSAARTGRMEMAESRREHIGMNDMAAGDPDVDVQEAYFSGEEAPGGDNPTPDQDIVDEIGKAVGLEYQDAEELDTEKVGERDKHRWELDPASSEDYKERK